MNQTNKKGLIPKGLPQPPRQQPHQSAPIVKRSVAPPVYRPQAKPLVQPRGNAGLLQLKKQVAAPPVYRPQSTPNILQTKTASAQRPLPPQEVNTLNKSSLTIRGIAAPKIVQPKAPPLLHKFSGTPAVRRPEQKQTAVNNRLAVTLPSRSGIKHLTSHPANPARGKQMAGLSAFRQSSHVQAKLKEKPARVKTPVGFPSIQLSRSAAPVCQLKYQATGRVKIPGWFTESGKYFVAKDNNHKLYAKRDAPGPKPASLFTKGWDIAAGLTWCTWTPNVQFLTKHDDRPTGAAIREYEAALSNSGSGTFIFGKNDCANFATALSSLIAEEDTHKKQSTEKLKGAVKITGYKNVGVGTQMEHSLGNNDQAHHHVATVVAIDGKDLVTLEADVRKPLTRPEFYIRSGIYGFVTDNDPKHLSGDEVYVSQLDTLAIRKLREQTKMLDKPDEADLLLELSLAVTRKA